VLRRAGRGRSYCVLRRGVGGHRSPARTVGSGASAGCRAAPGRSCRERTGSRGEGKRRGPPRRSCCARGGGRSRVVARWPAGRFRPSAAGDSMSARQAVCAPWAGSRSGFLSRAKATRASLRARTTRAWILASPRATLRSRPGSRAETRSHGANALGSTFVPRSSSLPRREDDGRSPQSIGTISNATMLMILISGLIAGPAVSL
jgi:hypothetical protein